MPDLPKVELCTLKSGETGVCIGEERLFLNVEYRGPSWWRFRLIDLSGGYHPRTEWIELKKPGDLRKAKIVRDILKSEYKNKGAEVLGLAIGVVQDNEETWLPKEEEDIEPTTHQTEKVTEEIKKQAIELLQDPLLLYRIGKDMEKWIVGEEDTSLLTFLLDISCKSPRDYAFQIISADSAAGKTWLVRHVLTYLPKEWWRKVGRLSRTSLDYLSDQNFDLLWIQERRGGKEAANSIRLSSVEDGGTAIWVTERNEKTGRFETHEYTVPGRSIITTTIHSNIDVQDLTRSWVLGIDESEDQTDRIHNYETKEAEEPLELKAALGLIEEDLRPVIHEALRQLDWNIIVVLPFGKQLKTFVRASILRSRRDLKKLIRLVRVVTLLFQKQRPTFEIKGTKFVVSFPQDVYTALIIAADTFHRTSMGLDEREKKVIEALKSLESASRREVARDCRKSMTWAYNLLQGLVDKGYVDVDEAQKTYMYSLRKEHFNPSLSVTDRLDYSVLEKTVRNFLDQSYVTVTSVGNNNISFTYFNPITGESISPTTLKVTHDATEQGHAITKEKEEEYPSVTDSDRLEQLKEKKKAEIDRYFNHRKKCVSRTFSIQETLVLLRSKWKEGCYNNFDKLVMEMRGCSREEAESLREKWLDEGEVAYDPEGLLVWV